MLRLLFGLLLLSLLIGPFSTLLLVVGYMLLWICLEMYHTWRLDTLKRRVDVAVTMDAKRALTIKLWIQRRKYERLSQSWLYFPINLLEKGF